VARIYLLRHGETAWSRIGRHTGRSDVPLTADGEQDAAALAPVLAGHRFGLVLVSPLSRARRTAQLAGLPAGGVDDDLLEWDYGDFEGRTTTQIRAALGDPHWVIWDAVIGPGPGTPGETPEQVAVRVARVIERCRPVLAAGSDCALVAHGHVLRILTATWLGLTARDGRLWALDAGALSCLGYENDQPVIARWNVLVAAAGRGG